MTRPSKIFQALILVGFVGICSPVFSQTEVRRGVQRQTPPGPCDELIGQEWLDCLEAFLRIGAGPSMDFSGRDAVEICQANCVQAFVLCSGKSLGSPIKLAICETEKFNCFIDCSRNE